MPYTPAFTSVPVKTDSTGTLLHPIVTDRKVRVVNESSTSRIRLARTVWSLLNRKFTKKSKADAEATQAATMSQQEKQLANELMSMGVCDERGVKRAWIAAQAKGRRFEDALTKLSIVSEQAIAEAAARLLHLQLAKGKDFPISPVLKDELRPCFLLQARCCPLSVVDGALILGIVDGFDEFTPQAISAKTGLRVHVKIILPVDFAVAFSRLYPSHEAIVDDSRNDYTPSEEDLNTLDSENETAFVIKHVEKTIVAAVESGASDIHFEAFEDRLCIRFRRDGVLVDVDTLPPSLAPYVVSRAKVMAHLDIAEKRIPQDGSFKLSVRGNEVNCRLSTMPSLHGEKAVIRILDKKRMPLDFSALGLEKNFVERWSKCLTSENGILLVVGPTGSGKSTTLYTSLKELRTGRTNIVTIEDPIEYRLTGINQSQIKPKIGLTFASMLRSILRQDPDIIMVGEIRDLETATIAVQAAMTGHLVLSTLHTNSAAAAIVRLKDIGLEPYAIASVVRGIAAQRLLRKLCDCKKESRHAVDLQQIRRCASSSSSRMVSAWEPVGCSKCHHTGYNGRFAVAELIVPGHAVKSLICKGASQEEIESVLAASGAQNLFEIATDAVGKGLTGVDEVSKLYEAA